MILAKCYSCSEDYQVEQRPTCLYGGFCAPADGSVQCIKCEVGKLEARIAELEEADSPDIEILPENDICCCGHHRGCHLGPEGSGACGVMSLELEPAVKGWVNCGCLMFDRAAVRIAGGGEPEPAPTARYGPDVGRDIDPPDSEVDRALDDDLGLCWCGHNKTAHCNGPCHGYELRNRDSECWCGCFDPS